MKKHFLLIYLIPLIFSPAQNLDSLFNKFVAVKGIQHPDGAQNVSSESGPVKCTFGIINQVKLNYSKFSPKQQKTISSLLSRPQSDTSFVTPRKWFRIHFSKTSINAPLYDMNELAKAADSSYNYEVNILGYPPPPKDAGEGGDDLYDIYVQNVTSGEYGYTEVENSITPGTYTSFMVIDNDFGTGYYTRGIDGARVTVAHEMHHGIQIGNYIYRDSDLFYYEITSTAMEEIVFNDINDYYYFMGSYFRNPQSAFSSNDGYNLGIWNLFLRDRFGVDIIKTIWELMPAERALRAMADAISSLNSDFKIEFNTFGQWTYFTNKRTQPGKYFKEAASYPLIQPMVITNTMNVNSGAVSNNFFQLNNITGGIKDSLVMLVSNCDIVGGMASPPAILPFTYSLSSEPIEGGKAVNGTYYSKLDPLNILFVETNLSTGIPTFADFDYAYPQPFRYSKNSQIYIPAAKSQEGRARLNVYSADLNLVYSGEANVEVSGNILWNGLDKNNKKLGTSVYLYVTERGGQVKKGKIVIYND